MFLDLPRLVCTWRLLKRRLRHAGRGRPDVAPGCTERLPWEFVRWVWDYPARRRPGILAQLAAVAGRKQVVILRDQAGLERFVAGLQTSRTTAG